MTELQIQDAVRLELGRYPQELGLWRNNIGVADLRGHKVRFGIANPGGADLIGLYRSTFAAIEIKTPIGRLSKDQKMFRDLVTRIGGVYQVIRSVEEAQQWLAEMRARYPGVAA